MNTVDIRIITRKIKFMQKQVILIQQLYLKITQYYLNDLLQQLTARQRG